MEFQYTISPPLSFFDGIIAMPLEVEGLAPQLTFRGDTYYLKEEFHSTLIPVKYIVTLLPDRETGQLSRQILEEVETARVQHEPSFLGYRNELRHVRKDDRQSIVIMVDVANLEPIFERLRHKYHIEIPSQPTHVTLYTTWPSRGIGIPSQEALNTTTKEITGPGLEELKTAMEFNRAFGDQLG